METNSNDDASDLLCWIDENHGNNDGITSENETLHEYEEMVGTEASLLKRPKSSKSMLLT